MPQSMADTDIKLQKAWMACCLIEKYVSNDMAGGCLHIVIEDGNYGKSNVEFCLDRSKEKNDLWGETIANLLLEFTDEEQEQIIERPWEIEEQL